MTAPVYATKPDRDPDLIIPEKETPGLIYLETHIWFNEGIVGFLDKSNESWEYFSKWRHNGEVTLTEYVELVENKPNHVHHNELMNFYAERELLS